MSAINLKNVYIDYPLEIEDGYSLKAGLISLFSFKKKAQKPIYRALENITLSIDKGERVGLIGLNGAGKSTLLRVMSGIYHPSQGIAEINGQVSPLLDFATGFELHHSGLENIKIRLMFLGESPEGIKEKINGIAEFSDLGDFIYLPARTYSTGMFLRLAFAASTAIEPEILIADEVVGAGDAQFAEKASARINKLLNSGNTTVISSHSMELVRKFCTRTIWLHKGKIMMDGSTAEVIAAYEEEAQKLTR